MSDNPDNNRGGNPLQEILNAPNKKISEAKATSGGVLSKWFRIILYELGIGAETFHNMLTSYLEVVTDKGKVPSNSRGSYHKSIASADFTWRTFLESLRVIGVWKIDFSAKLHHINGKKTIHHLTVTTMNQDTVTKLFTHTTGKTIQVEPEYMDRIYAKLEEGRKTGTYGINIKQSERLDQSKPYIRKEEETWKTNK